MSNFKKYMSIIQEMEVSKDNELQEIEARIKMSKNFSSQEIEVRIKMSKNFLENIELENIKDVYINNNLLTLDKKVEVKITPEEFDVLVKFKDKWASIYDTHAESMSIVYKNKDVNRAIQEINLFILMNDTNLLPDMIRSDTFIETALAFFTEDYVKKNEIKEKISPDLFRKLRKNDNEFLNDFSDFIKELNMKLAFLVKNKLFPSK